MKQITLRVPATCANVGPGYDIFAMTYSNPFDEISITLNDSSKISISTRGDSQNIPLEVENNSAGLAVRHLLDSKNIQSGVNICIKKSMTSGGGLGTTGASAAAGIFGLNKLLSLKLTNNEMIDFARMGEVASGGSPHADNVAAALLGGFVLVKSYKPIDVIKLNIPDFPIVLAILTKSQRTTRGFISYDIGEVKLKEQIAHCSTVIHAIHTKNIELFGEAISKDFVAEPVRGAAIPEYSLVKQKVLQSGAFGCNISGGGSSIFAICEQQKQDEIKEIMKKLLKDNPNFISVIKTKTSNVGIREIT
ncbi:MAG: homoserine kinase [Candidatus Cloacimonetes bacterium]|nr:homoserine kinase [Candidatus Cloacimonadota bacterium]